MPELGAVYEITQKEWFDARDVMYPEKWETCEKVEIFSWVEHHDDNTTYHFCKYKDTMQEHKIHKRYRYRFFKTLRTLAVDFSKIAEDIKFYSQAFPIAEKRCKEIDFNV